MLVKQLVTVPRDDELIVVSRETEYGHNQFVMLVGWTGRLNYTVMFRRDADVVDPAGRELLDAAPGGRRDWLLFDGTAFALWFWVFGSPSRGYFARLHELTNIGLEELVSAFELLVL